MEGVERGIADMKAGRVIPWEFAKWELGIEEDSPLTKFKILITDTALQAIKKEGKRK